MPLNSLSPIDPNLNSLATRVASIDLRNAGGGRVQGWERQSFLSHQGGGAFGRAQGYDTSPWLPRK